MGLDSLRGGHEAHPETHRSRDVCGDVVQLAWAQEASAVGVWGNLSDILFQLLPHTKAVSIIIT